MLAALTFPLSVDQSMPGKPVSYIADSTVEEESEQCKYNLEEKENRFGNKSLQERGRELGFQSPPGI